MEWDSEVRMCKSVEMGEQFSGWIIVLIFILVLVIFGIIYVVIKKKKKKEETKSEKESEKESDKNDEILTDERLNKPFQNMKKTYS